MKTAVWWVGMKFLRQVLSRFENPGRIQRDIALITAYSATVATFTVLTLLLLWRMAGGFYKVARSQLQMFILMFRQHLETAIKQVDKVYPK